MIFKVLSNLNLSMILSFYVTAESMVLSLTVTGSG